MSVASVTELSAVSPDGFEAATREALERANKTLRNIQGAWVKDMNVMIEDGNIVGYKVNLAITFVPFWYFTIHERGINDQPT
jgi:flavin-binding protein dodecin